MILVIRELIIYTLISCTSFVLWAIVEKYVIRIIYKFNWGEIMIFYCIKKAERRLKMESVLVKKTLNYRFNLISYY